jgi:putative alpha-1,2-mannosidase
MKHLFLLLPVLFFTCTPKDSSFQYVDPFIGTDASHIISMWRSEACTYPGAVAPQGMVQISPETSKRGDFLQGYYYSHDTIRRFGLAEHFSGWPDGSKGKGVLMPFTSKEPETVQQLSSSFSHDNESAEAGYYQVYLNDLNVDCQFTALTRSILGSLNYGDSVEKGILLADFKNFKKLSDKTLTLELGANSKFIGKNTSSMFLHFQFNETYSLVEKGKLLLLRFDTERSTILFKYAGSYVSAENAKLNLQAEVPHWDFNKVRHQSRQLWERELSVVKVEGDNEDDKTIFYTGLYHMSLLPINATDVNGAFPGLDQNAPLESDETHYIYFTPWDAFRTKHPLFNLINPKKERDFLRSMLRYYKTKGVLPEPEVMTGVHVSSLFADALAKGNKEFDIALAYEGLKKMLLEEPYFRESLKSFKELGYVPYPEHYATTATLEFAFNYWALGQVAREVGDEKTATFCEQLSLNYRNTYHPQERFMLTKNRDGSWSDAPLYAEADKWNMSWLVPHNTRDLINLMGGNEAFYGHLNENFEEGHFVLDNECPLNFPFLFPHAGKPWLTMKWKNEIMREHFNTSPRGIPGNDDWGSISSWYLCAALGLFPATPGTDEWIICSPTFDKITINQPFGKKLVIKSTNLSDQNIYVQSVKLAGKEFKQTFISQHELFEAGEVSFSMGVEPNKLWASNGLAPYSLTESTPDFEVTSLSSDKSIVNSNEELMVNSRVKNNGSVGSFNLQLFDADSVIHSQWVLLEENQEKSIDILVRLFTGGTHQLKISDQTAMITVDPRDMELSKALIYSAPEVEPIVHQGDSIRISFDVMNISAFPKEHAPQILVDGHISKTLAKRNIEPGQKNKLQYSLAPIHEAGWHLYKVHY